ncbi:hypothetical protein, partial [Pantoea sp. A4]|uniref:hypothetical protein n=1 Tax=Pantoea sp. A4 TaxID=1225184 RepID=UPI000560B30B
MTTREINELTAKISREKAAASTRIDTLMNRAPTYEQPLLNSIENGACYVRQCDMDKFTGMRIEQRELKEQLDVLKRTRDDFAAIHGAAAAEKNYGSRIQTVMDRLRTIPQGFAQLMRRRDGTLMAAHKKAR